MNDALKLDGNGEPAPVVRSEIVSELTLTLRQLLSVLIESEFGNLVPVSPTVIEVRAAFRNGDFDGVRFVWRVPAKGPATTILVNGHEKTVMANELSYDDVVAMALDYAVAPDPLPLLTVTFSSKTIKGILSRGEVVKVFPGMTFDAYDTGNAYAVRRRLPDCPKTLRSES